MVRLTLALVAGALVLFVGSVAAKPKAPAPAPAPAPTPKLTKGVTLEGVDPVFAGQLSPRPLSGSEAAELRNKVHPQGDTPKFRIKRLEQVHRARILGADDDAALADPIVFNAQNLYHDQNTWMIAGTATIGAVVDPQRNVIGFDATYENPGQRVARIRFKAEARTRYLLECGVEAAPGVSATFTARGPNGEFSTTSDERAALLLVHDANSDGPVVLELGASAGPWSLEGCELTGHRA